ncbi:hypothetical protein J4450_06185 [Candidatus Micrarchaeota archaeon]|nr:hypothetical protein [Candidatus Micrarchaeota archaeon]
MTDIFKAKLRKIGSSVGVLVPKEQLAALDVEVGDEIDVSLLKHKSREEMEKEIEEGFGMAKHFTKPFVRDKKTREF